MENYLQKKLGKFLAQYRVSCQQILSTFFISNSQRLGCTVKMLRYRCLKKKIYIKIYQSIMLETGLRMRMEVNQLEIEKTSTCQITPLAKWKEKSPEI